jgi:hypothetical protein
MTVEHLALASQIGTHTFRFTLVHFPTLPNPKFAGKTGFGDFQDALADTFTPSQRS